MKILVSTKRVPSSDEAIRVRPDGTGIDDAGVPYVLNPFDAIALEEAVRIREQRTADVEVVAVGIGGVEYESELRTALAMGADRALRVGTEGHVDPWVAAQVLSKVVLREHVDLVVMGKQAVDDDSNQTGQMLAGLLNWPQATFASKVQLLEGNRLRVERETDGGLETVLVPMPAVVTADLRLNEPRYASLPALMKAKRRPIETLEIGELGLDVEPKVRVVRLEPMALNRECVQLPDVAELVRRLRYEAKVI